MVFMKHIDCGAAIIEYDREDPPLKGSLILRGDWRFLDGTPTVNLVFNCPNCGMRTGIDASQLAAVETA